jgi:hypothetical protein
MVHPDMQHSALVRHSEAWLMSMQPGSGQLHDQESSE